MKVPHINSRLNRTLSASGNVFQAFSVNSTQLGETSETITGQGIIKTAGTVTATGLRIYLSSNTVTGGTTTFKSRVNNVDGGMSYTITAGATGLLKVPSGSDTLADGDTFGYQLTVGTGGNIIIENYGCDLEDSTGVVNNIRIFPINTVTASTTTYANLGNFGEDEASTTEANKQIKSPLGSVTWENFQTVMGTNARTTNTIIRARKNSSDLTYAQTITATDDNVVLSDYTTQESVALDDLIGYSVTPSTGTGALALNNQVSQFKHATSWLVYAGTAGTGITQNSALTRYSTGLSRLDAWTTEAQAQVQINDAIRFSLPRIYLSANSINTGTITVNVRKNGSTALTISITAGAGAGWSEQAVGSVDFAVGDLLSISIVTSGASGSITTRAFVMKGEPIPTTTPFLAQVMAVT